MNHPSVRQWLMTHTALEPALLEGVGFDAHVAERIASTRSGSESAYVASLDSSSDEVDRLTSGIAVPETWFFRYPQSFRFLIDHLERRHGSGAPVCRMASIGCATGEEPHSMAMAALHAGWPAGSIIIEAFDRSPRALSRARTGAYGPASIRGEIPPWAATCLQGTGGEVTVDPAVRALTRFSETDVTQPGTLLPGPARDVIFCRNLLIYLEAGARLRLLEQLSDALAPGGLLFVGHAEPLLCASPRLRSCAAPHAFVLERTNDESASATAPVVQSRNASRSTPPHVAPRSPARPATSAPAKIHAPEPTIDDARDLADAGRSSESETLIRGLLTRHGPSAEALELLGMIRMAAGDLPEAKRCFEQAVYLEPARTASLLQLAMISENKGDARRAETYWNRARRSSDTIRQEQRG